MKLRSLFKYLCDVCIISLQKVDHTIPPGTRVSVHIVEFQRAHGLTSASYAQTLVILGKFTYIPLPSALAISILRRSLSIANCQSATGAQITKFHPPCPLTQNMAQSTVSQSGTTLTGLKWINYPGYDESEAYKIAAAVVVPPGRRLVATSGHVGRDSSGKAPESLEEEFTAAFKVGTHILPLPWNLESWMD